MYTLYEMAVSGNCYKCRLVLTQLGLAYKRYEVNLKEGEHYSEAFKKMNFNAKVPILNIEGVGALPESNAILCYLAEGTSLMPKPRFARAQVMQWLFFEQYSHEPYIATVRFWKKFTDNPSAHKTDIERCMPKGVKALQVMENHLARHNFFVDEQYSIADIALYAYTHCAEDGGYTIQAYPAICRWMRRVENTPKFIPITA